MWSGVTKAVAASKLTGLGSSDCTFQPVGPKRIMAWADSTARLVARPGQRHLAVAGAVTAGQPRPTTCSLSRSPAPTVTLVASSIRSVRAAIAPRIDQANPEWS